MPAVSVDEGTIRLDWIDQMDDSPTIRRFDIGMLTKFPKITGRGVTQDGSGQWVSLGVQDGVTSGQNFHVTHDTTIYFADCDYRDWSFMFDISRYNAIAIFYLRPVLLDMPRGPMAWSRNASA